MPMDGCRIGRHLKFWYTKQLGRWPGSYLSGSSVDSRPTDLEWLRLASHALLDRARAPASLP